MAAVTATINVNINAANAAAQLAALQGKVATMNKGLMAATASGVMAQEKAIGRMGRVLSSSGMFTTGTRNVTTQLGRMHQEFDKGSTSLQNYRRNSQMWSRDHSRINSLAADRVKMLQSQYVALGKEMNGTQKAMQIKPDQYMREFGGDAQFAAQKAMMFRRNLQMGATGLVNWGKNTQWAGRQMMVGMGIPIAIMAAGSVAAFNQIEKASIAFKRVYGDTATSVGEKSQMLSTVQKGVAKDMMKYGISMADTLDVAAQAAATGAQGADLIAATRETMRLATLGNMDYGKALGATIAMQTAFNISADEMGRKTDFLNAVENQTILTMEDMALAVPRVAPVIKGLGGGIEELAIMMTALRQGGVTAEQGANALKSGLAAMINPTSTATEALGNMGINLGKITKANRGDIIGTVKDLGKAFDGLTSYKRQQALEALFGKYQYARMGALFKNINSKAVKETEKMANATDATLAKMSSQELGQIEASPMIKLKAAIEGLKAAAAPLGAVFSTIGANILKFITPLVSFFANNSWAKGFLIGAAGVAALAGTFTMIVGVLANFTGSMIKAGMAVKSFFRFITGQPSLAYISSQELEATAAANSLATASQRAASALAAQGAAAKLLASELAALTAAQSAAASSATALASKPVIKPASVTPTSTTMALPRGSQADYVAMRASAEMNHLGGTRPLTPAEIAFWQQNVGGKQDSRARKMLANYDPATQELMGKNSRTFMSSDMFNNRTKSPMPAMDWAKQMAWQGEYYTTSSLMNTMARNLGHTTPEAQQAWANSEEGRRFRSGVYNASVGAMGQLGNQMVSDLGDPKNGVLPISQIVNEAADKEVAKMPKNVQEAWAKTGQVSEIAVRDKATGATTDTAPVSNPKVTGALPKTGTHNAGQGVKTIPDRFGGPQKFGVIDVPIPGIDADTPTIVTDKNGKPVARVIPDSAPAGKKISASSAFVPPGTKGVTLGPSQLQQLAKTQPKTPVPTKPAAAPRSFTGMGLMGVGMAGMMGTSIARMMGKEVSPAIDIASSGLMGVGMVAQSFPKSMGHLSDGIAAVATKLGPWGIAIGAAAVAIGGTALLWKRFNENTRQQGIDLGRSLNDTTSLIDDVGTAFGKTSYVQEQIAKEQGVTTEQLSAAEQFIQSAAGQKMINDYASTSMKVSQNVAGTSMASKLASYVISGVMGTSDVKAFLGALKAESPAQGAQVERYVRGLMGAKLDKMPGTLASDIYKTQSGNTATTMELLRRQQAQAQGTSVVDSVMGMGVWDKVITAGKVMLNPFSMPGEAAGMLLQNKMDVRGSVNRVGGMMASATNTQIQSGLQNRLALEAQLNSLIEERDTLQKSASKTALGTDDAERLDYLNRVIPDVKTGITELGTALQSTSQGMDQMFAGAGTDQKNAVLDSLNTMIQESKDATAIFMADMTRNDKSLSQQQQFGIMSRLQNGALNPAGMQNMLTYARTGMQGISTAVQTLPVGKLQTFSLEIGKMTGPQAQVALTNFGRRFVNAANAANLSGREAQKAAKAFGASPQQAKSVRVKVKMDKIGDITKGVNTKISVSANTDGAKKKIEELRRAAEKATGKKIKINASDNAGAVIKRLEGLIRAAERADSQDPNVNTSTNAGDTEGEVQSLADTIMGIANVGPVNLDATDNATPVAEGAFNALTDVGNLSPNPAISVTSNASSVASATSSTLSNIPDEEVLVRVRKVGDIATGGLIWNGMPMAKGGKVGKVTGPGGPTDDKVPAMLSNGEFVMKAKAVDKYGYSFMSAINSGTLQKLKGGTKTDLTPFGKKTVSGKDANKEFKEALERETVRKNLKFDAITDILLKFTKQFGIKSKMAAEQFTQSLIENFSPKQINTILKNKKGAWDKFKKQQSMTQKIDERTAKLEARQQIIADARSAKAASAGRGVLLNTKKLLKKGNREMFVNSLDAEQQAAFEDLGKKDTKKLARKINNTRKKAAVAGRKQEGADAYKELKYQSDTALLDKADKQQGQGNANIIMADKLGVSLQDLDKMTKAGAKDLAKLADEAKKTSDRIAAVQTKEQLTNQSDQAALKKAGELKVSEKWLSDKAGELGISLQDLTNMMTSGVASAKDIDDMAKEAKKAADAIESYEAAYSTMKQLNTQSDAAMIKAAQAAGYNLYDVAQIANNLGLSMYDVVNLLNNGEGMSSLIDMAKAAKEAALALQFLQMTALERMEAEVSNNDELIAALQRRGEARTAEAITQSTRISVITQEAGNGANMTPNQLEAANAVREAQIAKLQAASEDLTEEYSDQLEVFEKISQHQQAIANLEKGRLGVASALTVGDIAAAAAAAMQQRTDTASFTRDQMRNQLEIQQQSRNKAYENEINRLTKINRDINNEIAMITAAIGAETQGLAITFGGLVVTMDQLKLMAAAMGVDINSIALNFQALSNEAAQSVTLVSTNFQVLADQLGVNISTLIAALGGDFDAMTIVFGVSMSDLLLGLGGQTELLGSNFSKLAQALNLEIGVLATGLGGEITLQGQLFNAMANSIGADARTLLVGISTDFSALAEAFGNDLSLMASVMGLDIQTLGMLMNSTFRDHVTGLAGDVTQLSLSLGFDIQKLMATTATYFSDLSATFNTDFTAMKNVFGTDFTNLIALIGTNAGTLLQGVANDFKALSQNFNGDFNLLSTLLSGDFSQLASSMGTDTNGLLTGLGTKFTDLSQSFTGDWGELSDVFGAEFTTLAAQMGLDVNDTLAKLGSGFTNMGQTFNGNFQQLAIDFGSLATKVGVDAGTLFNGIGSSLSAVATTANGNFRMLADGMGLDFSTIIGTLSQKMVDFGQTFNGSFANMTAVFGQEFSNALQQMGGNTNQLLIGLGAQFGALKGSVNGDFSQMDAAFAAMADSMGIDIQTLMVGFADQSTGVQQAFSQSFSAMSTQMKLDTNATMDNLSLKFEQITNGPAGMAVQFKTLATTMGTDVTSLTNNLKTQFSTISAQLATDYANLGDTIKNGAALQLGVASTEADLLNYYLGQSVTPLLNMNNAIYASLGYLESVRLKWWEVKSAIDAANQAAGGSASGGGTPPPPPSPPPAPTPPPPVVIVPDVREDKNWSDFEAYYPRMSTSDKNFLQKEVFHTDKGGGAWASIFKGWDYGHQEELVSRMKSISNTITDYQNDYLGPAERDYIRANYATGGVIPGVGNRDNVPIMATPGEFVVRKAMAAKFGPTLRAMNSGSLSNSSITGGNVNIGNVIFQINGGNLNARDVADIAVRRMKTLDSATIRGGRF